MDKLTVRSPDFDDLRGAAGDLLSLRTAPPMMVSAGAIMLLTGNLIVALPTVALTSFLHAFWARLVQP
jgi:hypothetical protein